MIYCSFCCIYVWLDPGTYMIARFMFFYKPGVTLAKPNDLSVVDYYDLMMGNIDDVTDKHLRALKGDWEGQASGGQILQQEGKK